MLLVQEVEAKSTTLVGGWKRRERAFARLRGTRLKGKFSYSWAMFSDWSGARPARRSGAERAYRGEASARRFPLCSHGFTKQQKQRAKS